MSEESKSSNMSEKSSKLTNLPTDVLKEIGKFATPLNVIGQTRVNKTFKDRLSQKELVETIKDFFIKELSEAINHSIINRVTLNVTDKMVSFFNSSDVQKYLPDIIEEIQTVKLKSSITLQNITHINIMNLKEDLKWLPNFPMMTAIVVKNCKHLTEFSCPKATTAWVENCKNLTELSCPEAKTVGVENCKNLTELSCPETIDVWVDFLCRHFSLLC